MSQETGLSVTAGQGSAPQAETEARLLALVLNGVTSAHSRRSYRTSLVRFFAWVRASANPASGWAPSGTGPQFTKAWSGNTGLRC